MNLSEGVRRLFVVFQWAAVILVLAIGWMTSPQGDWAPQVASSTAPKGEIVTDPVLIAELNAKLQAKDEAGKAVRLVPVDYDPFKIASPTWLDWIKHIALVAFSAVFAYYLVFAFWKLLVWVCSGFVATSEHN